MSTRIELFDKFIFVISVFMIILIIRFDIIFARDPRENDINSILSISAFNIFLIGLSVLAIFFSFGRVNELNVTQVILKDNYTYTETINGRGPYSDRVNIDAGGKAANYLSDKTQVYKMTKEFKKGEIVEIKIIETNDLFDKNIGNFQNAQIFIVDGNNLFEVPKSKIDRLGLKPVVEQYYDLDDFGNH